MFASRRRTGLGQFDAAGSTLAVKGSELAWTVPVYAVELVADGGASGSRARVWPRLCSSMPWLPLTAGTPMPIVLFHTFRLVSSLHFQAAGPHATRRVPAVLPNFHAAHEVMAVS